MTTEVGTDAPESQVDGRTARRDRNRDDVLDAAISLFAEGDLEPSAAAVAERSGVSLRSVYRYYEDLESLLRAAIARSVEQNLPYFEVEALGEGPLAERIDRLVTRRLALYGRVAGLARATVLRARTNDLVRAQLVLRRAALRAQQDAMFGPELDVLAAPARAELAAAIDLVVGMEAFDLLIHTHLLPAEQAGRVVTRALQSLLGA